MDDVTPLRATPAGQALRATPAGQAPRATPAGQAPHDQDVKREFFFGDRRLLSAEVVLPDLRNSLLVGTRLT